MIRRITSSRTTSKAAVSVGVGALAAVAFLVISRLYPLPVMIGALPVPLAVALALGTALAVTALLSPPSSRKPTLSMPVEGLIWLLVWWLGVVLTCALVASASWRVWGVIFLFATIAATVKVLSIFSYIKQEYEFRLWLPFATIIGVVAFMTVVGVFLGRPNIPPPIAAAVSAYRSAPSAAEPASRGAPDLSKIGFTLDLGGDVGIGGLPTTLFSYHSENGTRVDLYEADFGFPAPSGSSRITDSPGWLAKMGDLHLRAGSADSEFMVVGPTKRVVIAVAETLSGSG